MIAIFLWLQNFSCWTWTTTQNAKILQLSGHVFKVIKHRSIYNALFPAPISRSRIWATQLSWIKLQFFTVFLHYVIFVFFLSFYLFAEIPVFKGIFGIVICWRQLSLPSLQCYVYQLSSSYKYPFYLIQKRDKVVKRWLQLNCINLSSFLDPNVTLVETQFQFTT